MNKSNYLILFLILFLFYSCDETNDKISNVSKELKIKQILFASGQNVKEEDLFYAVFENINDNNYRIIDTKGSAIGIEAPYWYKNINDEIKLKDMYKDYLIFIYQSSDKNLNLISKQIDTIKINTLFNNYIKNKASSFYRSSDEFAFNGLKKEGDWWELIDKNGERVYIYTTIYLMKKDIFNSQLSKFIK